MVSLCHVRKTGCLATGVLPASPLLSRFPSNGLVSGSIDPTSLYLLDWRCCQIDIFRINHKWNITKNTKIYHKETFQAYWYNRISLRNHKQDLLREHYIKTVLCCLCRKFLKIYTKEYVYTPLWIFTPHNGYTESGHYFYNFEGHNIFFRPSFWIPPIL